MKVLKLFVAIAIIALTPFAFTACEDTALENCEQQDMNEIMNCGVEKNVEVCCTEGSSCVYSYNGTKYPDTTDGLNDLADALDCSYKSSVDYEEQHELIIKLLKDLKNKASIGF